MKRIEFTTLEFPNFIQVRQVKEFSICLLNGEVVLMFYYPSTDGYEIKRAVIEFRIMDV